MTIKARLPGEPDDIAHLVAHLAREFEVAGGDRTYPNRGSFGVRVYLEIRTRRHDTEAGERAKELDR